jgi:hypothetical protein
MAEVSPTAARSPTSPDVAPSTMSTPVLRMLRIAEMPEAEIGAIATADEPAIALRYIELHAERLAERLAEQLELLGAAERLILALHTGNAPSEAQGPALRVASGRPRLRA